MALRSVGIGYAEKSVNRAVRKTIGLGNSLTLPHFTELAAAEKAQELFSGAEMIKFAKNGSNVTTAAIKLARAYTRRNMVAAPIEQPFFSFDDWFIGSTLMSRGVASGSAENTLRFKYSDISSLQGLFQKFPGEIACVIMEPATSIVPCGSHTSQETFAELRGPCNACETSGKNLLTKIRELCHRNGALYISDEMITGFRWSLSGTAAAFGVEPDISTFGKAIANGFSLAVLAGKKEIMELGSFEPIGAERTFLLSSTHGAEMSSLGAFLTVAKLYEEKNITDYLWDFGKALRGLLVSYIEDFGLSKYLQVKGPNVLLTLDFNIGEESRNAKARTLFLQEMVRNGVIMPWIAPSYRHGSLELRKTERALETSLSVVKKAIESDDYSGLTGPAAKPVFRKYN